MGYGVWGELGAGVECVHRAGKSSGIEADVTLRTFKISSTLRFRVALGLAIAADLVQMVVFPLFVEGLESPPDDALDLGVGAVMVYLLGWHWEFAPSFLGKLVPGVDLVPFWTLAVANVYRKSRRDVIAVERGREEGETIEGARNP
jgi:hypothetical protein